MTYFGLISKPRLVETNAEKIKKEREANEEKFKKTYGISDAVYEKNFSEKSTKS